MSSPNKCRVVRVPDVDQVSRLRERVTELEQTTTTTWAWSESCRSIVTALASCIHALLLTCARSLVPDILTSSPCTEEGLGDRDRQGQGPIARTYRGTRRIQRASLELNS